MKEFNPSDYPTLAPKVSLRKLIRDMNADQIIEYVKNNINTIDLKVVNETFRQLTGRVIIKEDLI